MIIFLSTIVALLAGLTIYLAWKVVNLDRNLYSFFEIAKSKIEKLEESNVKILRSLTPSQAQIYNNSQCAKCKNVLPLDTTPAIDGHRYCAKCKSEISAQLQRLIDGFKEELPKVVSN